MSFSGSSDRRPPREPSAREQAALDWIARVDRGLSPGEKIDFERWLAADPRHAELFREFDGTWSLLDRVSELPASRDAAFVAAAATDASHPAPIPASPGPAARRSLLRPLLLAGLGAAAVLAFAVLGRSFRPATDRAPLPFAATETTPLGDLRTIELPDGSTVRLNTASTMEVSFSLTVRAVRLIDGEAHFSVAKDRTRPFTVTAAGVAVRAVGTAFNVRLKPEAVEVLVTEGNVQLREDRETPAPGGPTAMSAPTTRSAHAATSGPPAAALGALSAGEIIAIPRDRHAPADLAAARAQALNPIEIERTLAWQERRLEFVSSPLATMVEEFNRYNRRKLVIADAALARQHFGGNFRSDDADGFVRVLESNFRVVAEQRDNETILRSAP